MAPKRRPPRVNGSPRDEAKAELERLMYNMETTLTFHLRTAVESKHAAEYSMYVAKQINTKSTILSEVRVTLSSLQMAEFNKKIRKSVKGMVTIMIMEEIASQLLEPGEPNRVIFSNKIIDLSHLMIDIFTERVVVMLMKRLVNFAAKYMLGDLSKKACTDSKDKFNVRFIKYSHITITNTDIDSYIKRVIEIFHKRTNPLVGVRVVAKKRRNTKSRATRSRNRRSVTPEIEPVNPENRIVPILMRASFLFARLLPFISRPSLYRPAPSLNRRAPFTGPRPTLQRSVPSGGHQASDPSVIHGKCCCLCQEPVAYVYI